MAKAVVDQILNEFVYTKFDLKRKFNQYYRRKNGGFPVIFLIDKKDLEITLANNLLYATKGANLTPELEKAGKEAANYVFNKLKTYESLTGKPIQIMGKPTNKVIKFASPRGNTPKLTNFISRQAIEAFRNSKYLSDTRRKQFGISRSGSTAKLTEAGKSFKRRTQLLHNEGGAVGGLQVRALQEFLRNDTSPVNEFLLKKIEDRYGKIILKWNRREEHKKSGKSDFRMAIILTIGSPETNPPGDLPDDWKNIQETLAKDLQKAAKKDTKLKKALVEGKGSTPFKDTVVLNITADILQAFRAANNKGFKVKTTRQKRKNFKRNSTNNLTKASAFAANTRSKGRVKKAKGAQRRQKQSELNVLALQNMINQYLPEQLLKNMGRPQLENRSGRLRRSARVLKAAQSQKSILIDYTYQRDPYETFAPGGQRYTPERDVEQLISQSVRELAQRIVGNKFSVTTRSR